MTPEGNLHDPRDHQLLHIRLGGEAVPADGGSPSQSDYEEMPELEDASTDEETRRQRRVLNQATLDFNGNGPSDTESSDTGWPNLIANITRERRTQVIRRHFEKTAAGLYMFKNIPRMNAYRNLHIESTNQMGTGGLWACVLSGSKRCVNSQRLDEKSGWLYSSGAGILQHADEDLQQNRDRALAGQVQAPIGQVPTGGTNGTNN